MSEKKEMQYLYDLGLIYELGSNIGSYELLRKKVLANNKKTSVSIDDIDDLFNCGMIDKNFIIDNLKRKHEYKHREFCSDSEYNELCKKVFIEGIFQGYSRTNSFLNNIKGGIKEIFYFQGNFINPISLDSLTTDEMYFYKDLIKLFFNKYLSEAEYHKYLKKGCFLRADNIIAVTDKSKKLHINIVDNKVDLIFLLKNIGDKNAVIEGLGYLSNSKNKKLQFSNINTDTSSLDFLNFSKTLMDYATVSGDKNILKLIQTGAYAQSFLHFLEEKKLIDNFRDINISLSGDTNTDLSIINLKYSDKNTEKILINMRNVYSEYNRDISQKDKMKVLKRGFNKLSKSFNKNNKKNKEELNKMLNLNKHQKLFLTLSEEINNYTCTTEGEYNMQQQHTDIMINKFFKDDKKIICYLSGCPGIGKTYAYKTYVDSEAKGKLDRHLTLYFSPRNAINEDFIQFFFDRQTNLLKYDDMIILNSTSVDEKLEDGTVVRTINYSTNKSENILKKNETNLTYKKRGRDRTFLEEDMNFALDLGMNRIYEQCFSSDGVMKKTSEAIYENIYKVQGIKKIISYFTIQSLKRSGNYTTSSSLEQILSKVVTYNSTIEEYIINSEEFDKFAQLCPNIFIMIDEVTGSSEGAQLFNDIKKIFVDNFYNLLNDKQKEKITLKIIVADANLPNKKLMSKHLDIKSKIEQDKIYLASLEEDIPQNVYTEEVDKQTIVINANAYPALKINANYHIFNNSFEIKNTLNGNAEEERRTIIKSNEKMRTEVNSTIIYNAVNDIAIKKYLQTILFIQNKKRIGEIVERLKKTWEKLNKSSLEEGRDYIILSADLTEKERIKYIKFIEDDAFLKLHNLYPPKEMDDEYKKRLESVQYLKEQNKDLKFVLMTSTASRGISFKICKSMHILLQTSKVESFLTELSQAVYRPRGNWEFDRTNEKDLNYYITNNILYQEVDEELNISNEEENYYDFEYRKNVSLLNILSYLTLLRGTVKTRIQGYEQMGEGKYSIVPVGGKYVSSASSTILEQISGYRKQLRDSILMMKVKGCIHNGESCEDIMEFIDSMIIKIFNNSMTSTPGTIVTDDNKLENIFSAYMNAWESKDLKKLLNINQLHDYKVINGMMVFKVKTSTDELNFVYTLVNLREKLLKELHKLMKFNNVNPALKHSTGKIIKLLEFELGKNQKETLQLCENNSNYNKYVAIPIHVITSYQKVLEYDYSTQYSKDENDATINALDVMKSNIEQYADCQNVFPIISDFTGNYPFITFKSDNLNSIYNNKYSKDYVLSSANTNIFNLMMLNKQ